MAKERIKLMVIGLSYSQSQSGAYALVLEEEEGERRIPIVIGGAEAQSIAIKLEGLKPPRPLTHDLFMNFSRQFSIHLIEVFIYRLAEGIFYSELTFIKDGEIVRIDARTSDAIALAVRFNSPIYTSEEIMAKAGIIIESGESRENKTTFVQNDNDADDDISLYSVENLKAMLKDAVDSEDYEMASEIRDEIKRRDVSKK
ncbi:MAG: DUF151 domain-containing protein [Cytophagaceae bacterium]|jgi:bifunctional DNase/RNase|nr:DUF151 domain-containing protein [Cytophagaceae bacterium]